MVLLVLGAVNVGAGALLAAAGDSMGSQEKIAIVVLIAVVQYVIVQLHSWDDYSPHDGEAKRAA